MKLFPRVPQTRLLCAGVVVAALTSIFGCQQKSTSNGSSEANSAQSKIQVVPGPASVRVKTPSAEFVLNPNGYLAANLKTENTEATLDDPAGTSGQIVRGERGEISDFTFDTTHPTISRAEGKLGKLGQHIELAGKSPSSNLEERLTLEFYDDFPGLAVVSASFRNAGQDEVALESVELQRHRLNATQADAAAKHHEMWAFQGSSLKWGKDDVFAVPAKFSEENPFGAPVETKDDLGRVGGGVPVLAFWTKQVGVAIGHLETIPFVLSIPVKTTEDGYVEAGVRVPASTKLKPGETFSTPRSFVAVYAGDYYEPLSLWSTALDREGLSKPQNNDENYAVSWCGWGYESNVTPKQMIDTIPKLKELGIHWATLDDRWFNNYGDWQPRPDTFGGDSIRQMVKDFHSQGIKVQIWWLPLAVEDGHLRYGEHKYVVSDVVKEHPDWLILDEKGQPARMARNLATLCPALPEVREYYKQVTTRFIKDWDFDGHKLDNIYSTPRCFNPKHHHKSPDESVYAMGEVYKTIFETTRALKADSVTQSCPCGTPPSLAWLRYMDQAVTADPVGSVQVRRRIKMYKALLGPHSAVYGDHVELTRLHGAFTSHEEDVGTDFASTLGTGGVLGTKFTWPDYGPKYKTVYLNQQKMEHWKKWISLYNEKMLSKGKFLDLYVYGYDTPEAYAIEKDGSIYYAFYAPQPAASKGEKAAAENWKGEIELRGLGAQRYTVLDYVNNQSYGDVSGPNAKLPVVINGSLLLQVTPVKQPSGTSSD